MRSILIQKYYIFLSTLIILFLGVTIIGFLNSKTYFAVWKTNNITTSIPQISQSGIILGSQTDSPFTGVKTNELNNMFSSLDKDNPVKKQYSKFLSSLYILSQNYSGSRALSNDLTRDDFVRRGVANILESYSMSLATGYDTKIALSLAQKAIIEFNKALLITPSKYQNQVSINKKVSLEREIIARIKDCLNTLNTILNIFDFVLKQIQYLGTILDQEKSLLQTYINSDDPQIQKCAIEMLSGANGTVKDLQGISRVLSANKPILYKEYLNRVEKPSLCIQTGYNFTDLYNVASGAQSSLKEYITNHEQLLTILQQNDTELFALLCSSNQMQNQNQKTDKKLQDLMDMLSDPEKKNNENKPGNQTPDYKDLPENEEQQIRENLRQQGEQVNESINQLQGQDNYDVNNMIDQLFQDFYGDTPARQGSNKGR